LGVGGRLARGRRRVGAPLPERPDRHHDLVARHPPVRLPRPPPRRGAGAGGEARRAAAGLVDARRSIEAVWRIECPRLVASLTRLLRDVGLAEEVAQDAFVAALEQWPRDGVPDRPGAWLMAAARNRPIDRIRRERGRDERHALLGDAGGGG